MAEARSDQRGPSAGSASNDKSGPIREIMATVIALVILAVTLWMLYDTYLVARDSLGDLTEPQARAALDAYSRQRDVLAVALALLGAVIGYYFGRVPAERRADRAEKDADAAKENEATTKAEVRAGLRNIQPTLSGVASTTGGTLSGSGSAPSREQLQSAQSQLQVARDEVNRLLGLVS